MIQSPAAVLALLACNVSFFFWLEARTRWRLFAFLPPIVWVYVAPVILNNVGLLADKSPAYGALSEVALPALLVLMLMSIDLVDAARVVGRGAFVLVFAFAGTVLGAPMAYYLLRGALPPDAWKLFGALSGSWIGSSGNMLAVGEGVGLKPSDLGIAILGDNIIFISWLPLMVAAKRFAPRFDRWTGADKRHIAAVDDQAHKHMDPPRALTVRDVVLLIAIVGTVVAVANAIAAALPVSGPILTKSTWRTLIVTTLSIGLSFTPARHVPAAREIGIGLVYLFLASVGAQATIHGVAGAPMFVVGCVVWVLIHASFCVLGAKLLKADLATAVIASMAGIGGPASAPVVAAHHRDTLVPVSILMALMGYAAGNYLAFLTAELCSLVALP